MMRAFILAGAAGIACSLMAAQGAAEAPEPGELLVDCWDGTFAYTMAGLRRAGAGHELRVTSQDETLFAPLFPDADLDWGRADLEVAFPEGACTVDPERPLFSCDDGGATVTLAVYGPPRDLRYSQSTTFRDLTIAMIGVESAEVSDPLRPARLLTIEGTSEGETSNFFKVRTYIPFGVVGDCGSTGRQNAFTLYD